MKCWLIASLGLFAFAAHAQVPKATELWFDPSPDWKQSHPGKSLDYQQLFAGSSTWPITYKATKAFVLSVKFATTAPDAELTKVVTFVKNAGIKLAVTFPGILQGPNNCGSGIEGYYGSLGTLQREANRVLSHGGHIDYAVIDTPFYFGHQDTSACMLSVTELAKRVAAAVVEIKKVFPFVEIRENESPKTMAAAASDALAYYRALIGDGVALESVFFGVQGGGQAPPDVQACINLLKQVSVSYSLILIGTGKATSDADWVTNAQQKAAQYAAAKLSDPPLAMEIASWQPYPKHILPEGTFGSFTSLSAWYAKQAGIAALR